MDVQAFTIPRTRRALEEARKIVQSLLDISWNEELETDLAQQYDVDYMRAHKIIIPRLLVGKIADPFLIDIPRINTFGALTSSNQSQLELLNASITGTLKKLNSLVPRDAAIRTGEISAPSLFDLAKRSRETIMQIFTSEGPLGDDYAQIRQEWIVRAGLAMPIPILACRNVSYLLQEDERIRIWEYRLAQMIVYDLDKIMEICASAGPDEANVESADWTGQNRLDRQVLAIRQFAPIAFQALDDLVELHERIASNRALTEEERKAIALLRALHSDLGALIAAVEARRPFKAILKRVGRSARRVFAIAAETKELLIGGTPAIAAAGLSSLAAIKGLEWSGVDVGMAEASAALGLTGTVFGALSVTREMKKH